MNGNGSLSKVGIYVDTSNIYRNGGYRMRYDVLRKFAARDGAELLRLNAYVSFDADRATTDHSYKNDVHRFYSVLRDFGYKVIVKEVKWYEDENGKRYGKANADLDLAVDMLLQTQNLDRVLLVTGDGDFTRVVTAAQNRGCRVEVIALDNLAAELRFEADVFISGYVIPNLVPFSDENSTSPKWGEEDSRVRGVCYYYNHDRGYGFMRFLRAIERDIWLTDTRNSDSPYDTAHFRAEALPNNVNPQWIPSYGNVFEFKLTESNHQNGKYSATDIQLVTRIPS